MPLLTTEDTTRALLAIAGAQKGDHGMTAEAVAPLEHAVTLVMDDLTTLAKAGIAGLAYKPVTEDQMRTARAERRRQSIRGFTEPRDREPGAAYIDIVLDNH